MTMTLIETKTLGTATASIEFISIPQTFTDLVVLASVRPDGATTAFELNLNGDTSTANYEERELVGNGSVASSAGRTTAGTFFVRMPPSGATANTFSNTSIYLPNYTSSSFKSLSSDSVGESNATSAQQQINAMLYKSTSAITSLKISGEQAAMLLVAGTTISLYGILKGSDGIVTTS